LEPERTERFSLAELEEGSHIVLPLKIEAASGIHTTARIQITGCPELAIMIQDVSGSLHVPLKGLSLSDVCTIFANLAGYVPPMSLLLRLGKRRPIFIA
jgi:hypothetical protein